MSVHKFAFDTSFEEEVVALHEPAYSQHQVTLMTGKHYQQGYEEGVQEALASIHARNEKQLQLIHDSLGDILDVHQTTMKRLHEEIGTICHHMATVLLTEISRNVAAQEIDHFLTSLKPELEKQKEITISVHPDSHAPLQEKLETLRAEWADKTLITVKENPSLGLSDCEIVWETGGIDCITQRALQTIEETVQRYKDYEVKPTYPLETKQGDQDAG